MSTGIGKCNKIRHIVRLHQLLRRWRNKAAASSAKRRLPSDILPGHVTVCIGPNSRRFIVRATYLNHPVFINLLSQAEEEYGFTQTGPISIPSCDESYFEEILRFLSRAESSRFVSLEDFQRSNCHVGLYDRNLPDSRPLLEKSVWS